MLVADDFPELGADLVAALAALDVEDFSHGGKFWFLGENGGEGNNCRGSVGDDDDGGGGGGETLECHAWAGFKKVAVGGIVGFVEGYFR